jgi:hypothetical protein
MNERRLTIKTAITELRQFLVANGAVAKRFRRMRVPAGQIVIAETFDGRLAAVPVTHLPA